MRISRIFIPIYLLLLLVGCVAGEGGKQKATCSSGQVFDSRTRSCQGARVVAGAPEPITQSVSILEDNPNNLITLEYRDSENDFATSCSVDTGTAIGYQKKVDLEGLRIQSDIGIQDPNNTVIKFLSGSVAAVAGVTIGVRREITIQLGPSSSSSVISSLLNADPTISSWITATPLINQIMSPLSGEFPINEVDCNCFGGICRVDITPTTNYNGTTQFSYTLTDEDGTSAVRVVRLNVTSVDDAPVVSSGLPISADEKLDSDPSSVVSAAGNLITGGHITVTDVDSSSFSYQLVTPPIHGTIFIDSFGNFTYNTFAHETTDSFTVRAVDSGGTVSNAATVSISITTKDDPPVGTVTSISSFNEDGSAGLITLTYEDEEDAENDSAVKCAITSALNVYPDGGCFCAAGVCQVIINGLPNRSGVGAFSYRIYDLSPFTPQDTTVTFSISSQPDDPIAFPTVTGSTLIQELESETFVPAPISFTLHGASDDDGSLISSYTLVSAPTNGSLSGCLGAGGASGLSCTYTPNDGNLADSSLLDGTPPSLDLAQAATDTGTFYATTLGNSYNGLQIEIKNVRNTDESINTLYGANAVAYTNGVGKITILIQAGLTSGADIQSAINSNSSVSKLVSFDPGVGVQVSTGTISLASGVNTADKFVFRATDTTGASTDQTVHISIIPVDDRPTICEYSSYADTTVCGLNGCIGNFSPSSIVPDKDGLAFYSSFTGSCYVSSGGTWSPVESRISDRTINELDPIVIDNIKVDEGGGTSEDSESLSITNIDSSNENLIPLGNIEVYFDNLSTRLGTGDDAPFTLTGSGGTSADLKDLRLIITPQTINPADPDKSSEIEITVADSSGKLTEVTFTVNVQKVSATHGGWASFSATGPKVDALGLVNEDRKVCPYSLDLCESGGRCYGTSSPVNNSSAEPDSADAIFMQESGANNITCYRQKRNKVQNIAYVGKTSSVPTITYVEGTGVPSDTAVVGVSGNAITVTMYDDVTTTDTIVSAIRANSSANALVKVVNLKKGETQDTQSTVTLSALSTSSWESFETYCSATPAALEPGCAIGDKKSCVGSGSPVGSITPTKLDSRYWDEEANLCYRSTGTSSADWEAYDAPSEVKISWKQFNVNGSASISEYRVFRRLAGEEFDFSKPINRNTITGSTSQYTFTDNAKNSVTPPSPGTVYYYVVRPVVNNILTSTAAETGTNAVGIIRMMAPPKNMAFAHRWMINKRICEEMNRSPDPTNNYRCLYQGPGDVSVSGVRYYDIGKDLLVDRFEAGCPYSPAPACPGTFDNSCIGVGNPNTESIDPQGTHKVYYSRSEGRCYYNSTGSLGGWVDFNSLSSPQLLTYFSNYEPNTSNLVSTNPQFDSNKDKLYHRSSLPPLVNINQANANSFCSGLEDLQASEVLGINSPLTHRLPKRKDQVAYTLWDTANTNDSVIAVTETGLSLNSSSKCNSSGASGLDDGYVDFDKPDSNDFYSLPGTDASGIRSLATGSNETVNCTSAFGVQDAIGNVSEWTSNGLNCPMLSSCFSNESLTIQSIELVRKRPASSGLGVGIIFYSNVGFVTNSNLRISGAFRIIEIDLGDLANNQAATVASEINSVASSLVTATVIGESTDLIFPMGATTFFGIEVNGTDDTEMISKDSSDPYSYWAMDGLKGPCVDSDADLICDANISSWAFEDERFSAGRFFTPLGLPAHVSANVTFDTDHDLFEIGPTSGITSLKLHDDTVVVNSQEIFSSSTGGGGLATGGSYLTGNGAGVWNMEALPNDQGFGVLSLQDVTYKATDAQDLNYRIRYLDGDPSTGVTVVGSTVFVDLDDLPSKTATQVAIAVNDFVAGGSVPALNIQAYVTGDPTGAQAAFSSSVSFTDLQADALPSRVDVGFRCLIDVQNSFYDE